MSALRHSIIFVLEALAFMAALLVLAFGLLVGRLMMGPLTITSLTPFLEAALGQPHYGITAKITQSVLNWDKDQRKIVLDLSNVEFLDRLQQKIASIPQVLMVLTPSGYFSESHSPWVVVVRRPHMHMRLDKDGVLHLGALASGDETLTPAPKAGEAIDLESARTFLSDMIRVPHLRATGLGLFANLKVEEAGLTVIDEGMNNTWNMNVPLLSLRRVNNDYQGKASLKLAKNKMDALFDFALTYKAATNLFTASWSFDHINPGLLAESVLQLRAFNFISAPITGSININFDDKLTIREGGMNVNFDAGELHLPDFYEKPLSFKAGQLVARYDGAAKKLDLAPMQFDVGKAILKGEAEMNMMAGLRPASATFTVSNVSIKDLPHLWPEQAGKNARDWILENITAGVIDKASVTFGLRVPDDLAQTTLDSVRGHLSLQDATMIYWHPLPTMKKVNADAVFDAKGFTIDIKTGEVGAIKLKPSRVMITGLDAVEQIMNFTANLQGPVADVLALLDREPLGYAKKMNLNPKNAGGVVDGALTMTLPLLKALTFDQIDLQARTDIANGSMKNIAGLVDLDAGVVAIDLDKKGMVITGKGTLSGVPAYITWQEKFIDAGDGAPLSHGLIQGQATGADIENFGVGVAVHSSAAFPITLDYQRFSTQTLLKVHANPTAVQLDLPDMLYSKVAGAEAVIETALAWGAGKPMQLSLAYNAQDSEVKGGGVFDAQQKLSILTLDPLNLGATRAAAELKRSAAGVPALTIKADVLDMRGLFTDKKQNKVETKSVSPAPPPTALTIDLAAQKVLTHGDATLDKVRLKGERDAQGWRALDVFAQSGKIPFSFSLQPRGNNSALAAATPDLGVFLKALNVTDSVTGGKLTLDGKGALHNNPRSIFGHIKLENYHVKNMPALTTLFSAISPDGLAELLGGRGLSFGVLSGEYVWAGDVVTITKAHTSVGSIGLTTAGRMDMGAGQVNLEGQVIPVYFINKILGAIPLLGDLLTGGENQGVFAATYSVKGPLDSAKISVNPVSVLAPGFLRNILFMDKDITKGQDKKRTGNSM